jgi:hypothetical protein
MTTDNVVKGARSAGIPDNLIAFFRVFYKEKYDQNARLKHSEYDVYQVAKSWWAGEKHRFQSA